MIASGYVVQYGAGSSTSSPGSHSAANAAYTVTEDGEIRSWNESAERLFGYTAGEYLTDRQGNGVDLMLGVRVGAPGKRGIVLGANASLYDGGPHTLVCHQATRRDGCIQPFPFFELAPTAADIGAFFLSLK